MQGGKGDPGEGIGNGFLRRKADKREIDSLLVFITELLPVSRRENVISTIIEGDQGARARLVNVITWHGTQEVTIPDTDWWKISFQPMRSSAAFHQDSEVDNHTLLKATAMLRTEGKTLWG